MNNKIIIIGGGVSGITTALTLQLLGFKTTCYAKHLVDKHTPDEPLFASLYPAASVIPHSVKTDKISTLFPASLQLFQALHPFMHCIAQYRHFELFEFAQPQPPYTQYLQNFSNLEQASDRQIPHRKDAPDLHGWVFDCFIAVCPQYIHQLYTLYQKCGGIIKQQKLNPGDIAKLPAEIIINCSGAQSKNLFEDHARQKLIRGHLVHVLKKEPILDEQSRPTSYSYTPLPSVYATPDGSPSDVYCYPLSNKWILGGSRLEGHIDEAGHWVGQELDDMVSMNDIKVPRPILSLNADILEETYGLKIDINRHDTRAKTGYRFMGNENEKGLRLESIQAFDKMIIHNYGHGGAGVCLSWGCALEVLHLLKENITFDISSTPAKAHSTVLKNLQAQLQQTYWKHIQS